MRSVRVAVLAAWTIMACGGDSPDAERVPEPAADTAAAPSRFAPELGIDTTRMTRTPNGVYYEDVQPGRGAVVTNGKRVTIEYKAWLPNGTLFEQRPNAEGWGASEFVVGTSAPVRGLDEGLEGMRAGAVRKIVIPPHLGYGLVGRPAAVPEGSSLVYELKLVKVDG